MNASCDNEQGRPPHNDPPRRGARIDRGKHLGACGDLICELPGGPALIFGHGRVAPTFRSEAPSSGAAWEKAGGPMRRARHNVDLRPIPAAMDRHNEMRHRPLLFEFERESISIISSPTIDLRGNRWRSHFPEVSAHAKTCLTRITSTAYAASLSVKRGPFAD